MLAPYSLLFALVTPDGWPVVLSKVPESLHAISLGFRMPSMTWARAHVWGPKQLATISYAPQASEDPVIVLPCGHAFFMSGMDEYLELEWRERSAEGGDGGAEWRGCYKRGSDGAWVEPAPLPVGTTFWALEIMHVCMCMLSHTWLKAASNHK